MQHEGSKRSEKESQEQDEDPHRQRTLPPENIVEESGQKNEPSVPSVKDVELKVQPEPLTALSAKRNGDAPLSLFRNHDFSKIASTSLSIFAGG